MKQTIIIGTHASQSRSHWKPSCLGNLIRIKGSSRGLSKNIGQEDPLPGIAWQKENK